MKDKKVVIFGPWLGEFSYELSWWNPEIRKIRNDRYKDFYSVHIGFKGRRAMYKDFIDEYISIPEELEDSIRMRLKVLHEEDRIILEAAAEIGRSFSVTLLAAGLEQDRLTLLRSLKRIEDDFHLIIDVQTTDDIMSLESQTLRRVLRENSIYTNNSNKRELYKEMHFKIAQKMIENEDV